MQGLRETTVCTQARFSKVSSVPLIDPSLPCDMSINQSYFINFIVDFIAFFYDYQ